MITANEACLHAVERSSKDIREESLQIYSTMTKAIAKAVAKGKFKVKKSFCYKDPIYFVNMKQMLKGLGYQVVISKGRRRISVAVEWFYREEAT